MIGLTFLWPIPWFPLFLAMSFCYSYRNNVILLGQPFISSLSGLAWPLVFIYLWAPMSLLAFPWASSARLLSLGFLGPFANSTFPWAFY